MGTRVIRRLVPVFLLAAFAGPAPAQDADGKLHFTNAQSESREIARKPKVLLVGQPTRGVDIGAIEFIHRQLLALRDAGCAILLVSVELDEVMALSDRILVMFQGRIVGEVAGDQADERTLGLMMANAHGQSAEDPAGDDQAGEAA